ncbi:MAG TPA: hypothetical protein VKA05_04285 [Acidimicrobiales bacterium]|nr:hypothetical protein [Acidimicrobiales bacterium]
MTFGPTEFATSTSPPRDWTSRRLPASCRTCWRRRPSTSPLYITHRTDELAASDDVYVIADGRVVEHAGGGGRREARAAY